MRKQGKSILVLVSAVTAVIIATAVNRFARTPGETVLPEHGSGAGIRVVATIFPLADLARQVGGDRAAVSALLPPGASPHTYEATPDQAKQVARADLLLLIGSGLDPWAEKLLAAGTPGRKAARLAFAEIPGLPEPGESPGDACHGCAGDDHPAGNPHLWLDPVMVRDYFIPALSAEMSAIDPEGADYYRRRTLAFREELDALDSEIRATVSTFATSKFVSFHPAWTWFAHRYGLEEAAVIRLYPEREPSPGDIRRVVAEIRAHGIGAIFAEKQFSPLMAEVIAAEAGVSVLTLDPLGDPAFPGRDSYPELIRHNVEIMSRAMR